MMLAGLLIKLVASRVLHMYTVGCNLRPRTLPLPISLPSSLSLSFSPLSLLSLSFLLSLPLSPSLFLLLFIPFISLSSSSLLSLPPLSLSGLDRSPRLPSPRYVLAACYSLTARNSLAGHLKQETTK